MIAKKLLFTLMPVEGARIATPTNNKLMCGP
jgi:hypothetical protein